MITFSLVLNVPFVVVVRLVGPCMGATPKGKHVVLIIVVVLPESHRATSVLSRGTRWIVVALIYKIGVRSCLWLKDLVLLWYVIASGSRWLPFVGRGGDSVTPLLYDDLPLSAGPRGDSCVQVLWSTLLTWKHSVAAPAFSFQWWKYWFPYQCPLCGAWLG